MVRAHAQSRGQSADPNGEGALEITEGYSGCTGGGQQVRRYEPTKYGYVAADGSHISRRELDEVRARVLASRPGPTEEIHAVLAHPEAYLASLGFDDATLIAHVPELASWMLASYRDEHGNLPPGLSDLPLFEVEHLREELVDYLLRAPDPSTTTF